MTDTTTTPPTAFCQNCGTPLTPATTRTVGPATYCEPCLDARLHGPSAGVPRPPYPGTAPYPPVPSVPNPGLAALLGLIPGVGAMYNEQYAKGIVHLIVFAVLVVLSGDVNGIFGIFIAGWECYMVIEAHHTARARRDHTPLPNPFGLNDISERLGFGKAWPGGTPNVSSVFHDAAQAAAHAAQQFQTQSSHYGSTASHAAHAAGRAADAAGRAATAAAQAVDSATSAFYTPSPHAPADAQPFQEHVPPPSSTFGDWSHSTHQYAQNPSAGTQQSWRDTFNSAPPPSAQQPFPSAPVAIIAGHHRFPIGAVWLIAAGAFFLLATTGIFSFFRGDIVVGLGLIAIAVWLFLRRMLDSGPSLSPTLDPVGAPAYTLRTLRALRASSWVGLTGILFLLNSLQILRWNHSWPLYIILAGVMGFIERAAQHHATLYPPTTGPTL